MLAKRSWSGKRGSSSLRVTRIGRGVVVATTISVMESSETSSSPVETEPLAAAFSKLVVQGFARQLSWPAAAPSSRGDVLVVTSADVVGVAAVGGGTGCGEASVASVVRACCIRCLRFTRWCLLAAEPACERRRPVSMSLSDVEDREWGCLRSTRSGGRSATSGREGRRVPRVVFGSAVGSAQLNPAPTTTAVVVSSNVGLVV